MNTTPNFTQEEINKAKAYYKRMAEAMRPIPTPEQIEQWEKTQSSSERRGENG